MSRYESPRSLGFQHQKELCYLQAKAWHSVWVCLQNGFPDPVYWYRHKRNLFEVIVRKEDFKPNDAESIRSMIKVDSWLIPIQDKISVGELLIDNEPFILISVSK